MESPLSSPGRLGDPQSARLFKALFLTHGAIGYHVPTDPPFEWTEQDRFRLIPLVFGLMPGHAFQRLGSRAPIKPAIREHLSSLSLPPDEQLVDVLKAVCDQYYETRKDPATGRPHKKKLKISDIRSGVVLYRTIMDRQSGRCTLCGLEFGNGDDPTLDHVLPWRLVGDIPDGSNYQFLCARCNSSKGSFISHLQSNHSLNWVYGGSDPLPPVSEPSLETRYVVLAKHRSCSVNDCAATRADSEFVVVKRSRTGLAIFDNLTTVCVAHLAQMGSPAPAAAVAGPSSP